MIAFGGKRENGARKVKNESRPLFGVEPEFVAVLRDECDDRREKNVRNTAAIKNETAITARGSRMVDMASRSRCRKLISYPAAVYNR